MEDSKIAPITLSQEEFLSVALQELAQIHAAISTLVTIQAGIFAHLTGTDANEFLENTRKSQEKLLSVRFEELRKP